MSFDAKHPTEEFLRSIDIHKILPQQEPFVMVGKLVHFDERLTVTETIVEEGNMFVADGCFTSSGLVENIAQTCAARIGYVDIYVSLNERPQIGYIGAIRNLEIFGTPAVGDLITTRLEVQEEVFGMILARAEIVCNGRTIVSAEMKIALAKGDAI